MLGIEYRNVHVFVVYTDSKLLHYCGRNAPAECLPRSFSAEYWTGRERERERDKTNRTRMSRWSERVDSCQTPAAAITRVEARALGPIELDRSGSGAPRPVTKPRRPRLTEVPSPGQRALWTERRRGPTTVNAWTNHNFSDDVRASRGLHLNGRPGRCALTVALHRLHVQSYARCIALIHSTILERLYINSIKYTFVGNLDVLRSCSRGSTARVYQ